MTKSPIIFSEDSLRFFELSQVALGFLMEEDCSLVLERLLCLEQLSF